jgi:hypothetical protein
MKNRRFATEERTRILRDAAFRMFSFSELEVQFYRITVRAAVGLCWWRTRDGFAQRGPGPGETNRKGDQHVPPDTFIVNARRGGLGRRFGFSHCAEPAQQTRHPRRPRRPRAAPVPQQAAGAGTAEPQWKRSGSRVEAEWNQTPPQGLFHSKQPAQAQRNPSGTPVEAQWKSSGTKPRRKATSALTGEKGGTGHGQG